MKFLPFIVITATLWSSVSLSAQEPSADSAFFEKQVRPILVQHCYSCHSHAGGKMRGGLALDSRSGWEKGGESGPAVVPGNPGKSLLIKAVQHGPDLKMPPKEKLADAQVKTLIEWVSRGAPDPRVVAKVADPMDWWSLRPLVKPDVPAGPTHPIDAFIQTKLKTQKLAPAPEADRRTLLRRLKFNLHGLPPTPEEVDAFVADPDPKAYEKLIDRLLASPNYGERWARHWLDVIRYGDSRGNEHDGFREHAWRYRDYVIERFNADVPYDRFIHEQLAADAFFPEDAKLTAALGFLAAGPDVLSGSEYTVRDEFITTAMSAFVSSTVQCARCHNHKFDPISLEDYYGLQAIFAGVNRRDVMVDLDPQVWATRARWLGVKAAGPKGKPAELISAENKTIIAGWEKALGEKGPKWKTLQFAEAKTGSGAKLEIRKDGAIYLAKPTAETDTYTLVIPGPITDAKVLRLELLTDAGLPMRGPGLAEDGSASLSELEIQAFTSKADKGRRVGIKSSKADILAKEQTVNRAHDNREDSFWSIGPGTSVAVFELSNAPAIPADGRFEIVLRQKRAKKLLGCFRLSVTDQSMNPYSFVPTPVTQALATPTAKRTDIEWQTLAVHGLPIVADEAIAQLPVQTNYHVVAGSLPHEGKPGTPRSVNIMLRGDGGKNLGTAIPGAISSISGLKNRLTAEESKDEPSRRKYLAEWISDPKNPLTWRSIVNRVWHHHFGRGIVETLNDFGRMGGTPSHPELLDWLAADFRDDGKSFKKLHRLILTSAAYRQAVVSNPQAERIDAENRLLWRMNRTRLDAESFRDTVLSISGRLDAKMGGPGVLQFEVKPGFNTTKLANYDAIDWNANGPNRRSIYRFIFRTRPDPFMSAMDFPDASQFVPARSFSASPLQALVLFNNHFVLHHCEQLAQRVKREQADPQAQVRHAFGLTLQREPNAQEATEFTNYANRHGLAAMCRVLMNSNEFLFVE